ncbi:BspA family leucine-rich repeat surface protein [Mycoplasma cottewii]|uniref:BspA family leucine-rich repeat surface protein n=1 Tax=Mycoplasma cottewii TaxID=51364 RepID=A0ABY5TVV0_9MOLU|nr:BspA family leucine-rich repeat surface protein [Mycoplasma cottewii]UWD34782.1 BspA family leucine-rich repeat surface protein [Mycoplasma cottewii]
MKLFKWLGLTFLTSTSVISTSALIFSNVNKQSHTLNPQNNQQDDNITTELNRLITIIKTKITEINNKVGQLLGEKQRLIDARNDAQEKLKEVEDSILDINNKIATEQQSQGTIQSEKMLLEQNRDELSGQIRRYDKDIELKDREIKGLEEENEKLNRKISATQAQIDTARGKNIQYETIIHIAWNSKMRDTVWGGETYKSLLDRLNKTLGFKFELQDESKANNKIEKGPNDKKFKVKKGQLELELDMGDIYEKSQKASTRPYFREGVRSTESTEILKFGWDENGKIENIGEPVTKVPKDLPWFITDLSGAFKGFKFRRYNHIINLEYWDTSNVTNMSSMFEDSMVNQAILTQEVKRDDGTTYTAWDTSNVTNMSSMFKNAKKFNQDISNWNVSNVRNMSHMFNDAINYESDLSTWNIHPECFTLHFITHTSPLWNGDLWNYHVPKIIRGRYNDLQPGIWG